MGLRPDPEPPEINLVRVVYAGMTLWAVAFVVLLLLHRQLAAHHATWWLWACAAGVALGIPGGVYCHRRDAARDRATESALD